MAIQLIIVTCGNKCKRNEGTSTNEGFTISNDEVVHEAGVAKGTFYGHFNDLGELAAAVADELVGSFDDLIQPQRLSISDPFLRVAFGSEAFIAKALQDRAWASLVASMARSYTAVEQIARSRFSEDLREGLERSPQAVLSLELAQEVALGIVLQVVAGFSEGRLQDSDRLGPSGAFCQPGFGIKKIEVPCWP